MLIPKTLKSQKVLLDTHVWIWVSTNDEKISRSFKQFILDCHKHSQVYLSPISFWELGMLVKKGKLKLSLDCYKWVKEAAKGLRIAPITARLAIHSSHLPGDFHGDPADRLLVATASLQHLALATADGKILEYGQKNSLTLIDPRS